MLAVNSLVQYPDRPMGRPLQVDWQDSENDLQARYLERYLEEIDHQDRTRLHALRLTSSG